MAEHLTTSPSQVLSPASSQAVMEKYIPRNILITGGAGFIASHVAIRLAKQYGGYKVSHGAAAAGHGSWGSLVLRPQAAWSAW